MKLSPLSLAGEALPFSLVEDGRFGLDGGAMFGVVPRTLWERRCPADASHRIALTTRCLLLRSGPATVLVDCGLGQGFPPRERERFALRGCGDALDAGLARAGLAPEDISHVVLSHLHFDHAAGLVRPTGEGGLRPRFPRAEVLIQRRQWQRALAPGLRDRASYRSQDFAWLEGDPRLRLLDEACTPLPGIELFPSEGHTDAMQLLRYTWERGRLVFGADLFPTRHHLRLAWHMGYDLRPLDCVAEKAHWLANLADSGDWLVLEHDPEVAVCTVVRKGDDFDLGEVVLRGAGELGL